MAKFFLTPTLSKFLIEDTKHHLTEESNSYVTIGRSTLYGNPVGNNVFGNIRDTTWTINERNTFFKQIVGAKKIGAADIQFVIPRRDWVSGNLYDQYDDDDEIFSYLDQTTLGRATVNAAIILDGLVGVSNGSNALVGIGTSFLTYVFPGDQILTNNQFKTVVTVTNNTHLIVNSAYSNTNSAQAFSLSPNGRLVYANTGTNFSGNVYAGDFITIGNLTKETKEVSAVRSNKVLIVNTNTTITISNSEISKTVNTYPYRANSIYVRNNRDQVFKCLFNGNTSVSTMEPVIDIDGQLPENPFITTVDGYKWKYMYTIPPGLKQKFFNNQWMPVVQEEAVTVASQDGRLDIVQVLWGGSGYINGGNSNTASILSVTKTDGIGANLVARVSNGNISSVTVLTGGNSYTTGTITVTDPNRLPDIVLGGTVNVSGTVVLANTSNTSNQVFVGNVFVNDIITVNGESRNVTTVTNATHLTVNSAFTYSSNSQIALVARSNAVFDLVISPYGGHGSDPIKELGCHTFMICVELEDTENETIPISDSTNTFDFNQIGVLVDPLVANGAFTANLTNYRFSTRLGVSNPSSLNFVDDETIYVGSSIESATAIANVAHWSGGDSYLYINNITGRFNALDTIKGVTSGASVPILSVANSEVKLFSGDLLYVENKQNMTRKDNQVDQIKIILSF